MTAKEMIAELSKFPASTKVIFSSDEELNTLREGGHVARLDNPSDPNDKPRIVIYGLDGTEIDA